MYGKPCLKIKEIYDKLLTKNFTLQIIHRPYSVLSFSKNWYLLYQENSEYQHPTTYSYELSLWLISGKRKTKQNKISFPQIKYMSKNFF